MNKPVDLIGLSKWCADKIPWYENYAAKYDPMAPVINGTLHQDALASICCDQFFGVYRQAVDYGCELIGPEIEDALLPEPPMYAGSVGSNRTAAAVAERLKTLKSICDRHLKVGRKKQWDTLLEYDRKMQKEKPGVTDEEIVNGFRKLFNRSKGLKTLPTVTTLRRARCDEKRGKSGKRIHKSVKSSAENTTE